MDAQPTAAQIVRALHLEPHPEGGFFAETWRAAEAIAASGLPDRYAEARAVGTAIYYLLTPSGFSALHRLQTDEVWHHYAGASVEMLLLAPDGSVDRPTLGPDVVGGERPQVLVWRGIWQGARVVLGGEWALCGCTLAPGFDFTDFEEGDRAALLAAYPAHTAAIRGLSRV